MKFRPCIDIHNGKVKQLVGGSLRDKGNQAQVNNVSDNDADYFAKLYKKNNQQGGHIIILNASQSEFFEASKRQAMRALREYPGGMQIGGGINADNALEYIDAGASHVIVTSFAFSNGKINYQNIQKLIKAVGKEHIVLDLSCRRKDDNYYIVTDRWQKFTDVQVCEETLNGLSEYCDEFLVHGVDVEGKKSGMDQALVEILAKWKKNHTTRITYAGGIATTENIEQFEKSCYGLLDFTIGSALSLFGGHLSYEEITKKY